MSAPNNNTNKSGNTYLSSGQVLTSPPLTARITRFSESAIQFFGLYFVSLLSFDAYSAAENSSFATQNNTSMQGSGARTSGGSTGFGGGSGSGGRPDPRGPGQRLGTIDQVRGPECGSCK
ncbi:hypothetical protein H072_9613 [Dactylellina haptotyla CBS 200.50]|uniref:Uncharacterized protein n=1 Tax=Dactylellina haptotyla (strain CBS 200.50) TaxID=1284197 RepID=S8A1K9_DACHA|nr:hypothetical protein H072_9613 [Dactylellina haptotyla CBS 200.50]